MNSYPDVLDTDYGQCQASSVVCELWVEPAVQHTVMLYATTDLKLKYVIQRPVSTTSIEVSTGTVISLTAEEHSHFEPTCFFPT